MWREFRFYEKDQLVLAQESLTCGLLVAKMIYRESVTKRATSYYLP